MEGFSTNVADTIDLKSLLFFLQKRNFLVDRKVQFLWG